MRNCRSSSAQRINGGAARRAASMQVRRSLVTITHAQTIAIAQVMLFGD